ncbi:MAG: ATP-binding cassette domain-containing protein [Azospirillum sp.]|nr:ATP-binding cassette domain-containing protein [Azospirillum sp.]
MTVGAETAGPIIRVEQLTARFGERTVLDRISLAVPRGAVFVILGGSGAGKTTLLKHMIGLYRPSTGRVLIEEHDLVSATGDRRRALLTRFGVMYQRGALFGSMTLEQNVCLPLEEFTTLPPAAMTAIASAKLALVGLAGFNAYLPAEISGGMQKRAAIARAMALDPPILFLDEPSAGLDPVTSAELDELILDLNRTLGITFVIVSHELASIFAIASRAVMIDAETKTIIAEGTPQELSRRDDDPRLRRFFRREARPDEPASPGAKP